MLSKRRARVQWVIAAVVVLLTVALLALNPTNTALEITRVSLESPLVTTPLRIAVISDVHGSFYGAGGAELVNAVKEARPDMVVFTGDTLEYRQPIANAEAIIAGVAELPSFAVLGNHEFYLQRHYDGDPLRTPTLVLEPFAASGVPVLRGECVEFAEVLVCGIDDPITTSRFRYPQQLAAVSAEAEGFDGFTILLAHRPERIGEYLSFDLALSGHAHGGQWRIPGVLPQGIYAPHQGLLPQKTSGLFSQGDTWLLVSRGLALQTPLGSTRISVPRIFNRPELVVLDLLPV